jgi:two-component system CheB/CheR fusion protein
MNLDIGLPVAVLRNPLRQCLSGESTIEALEVAATNRRGRAMKVEVTCTPFALGGNPAWGVTVLVRDRS